MEYSAENTVIGFDTGDFFITVWIDLYYGDHEYEDDPPETELDHLPVKTRRNAIKCGRDIDPKHGLDGASWMFGHEFVMAGDVQELRARFEKLKTRAIDAFDFFPEHDETGKYPCMFAFAAKREDDGATIWLRYRTYSSDDDFEFHITEEKLGEVCNWIKRINEWFPPVGPDDVQVKQWPVPKKAEE